MIEYIVSGVLMVMMVAAVVDAFVELYQVKKSNKEFEKRQEQYKKMM